MTTTPPPPAPAPLCPIPRNGLSRPAGLILSLLLTLASATCGITAAALPDLAVKTGIVDELIAILASVLLTVYLWRTCRRSKGVLAILIASAILPAMATGSGLLSALLLSLVFVMSEGSLLVAVLKQQHIPLLALVPLLGYATAAAVSGDLVLALLAVAPFPAMLALGLGTRRAAAREDGPTRVGVICGTALALGIALLAVGALLVYRTLGTLAPDRLAAALESFREAMLRWILDFPFPGVSEEAVREVITPEVAENTVNATINLLPGYIVCAALLVAAVAQSLQHAALHAFGYGESVTDRVRLLRMSAVSCAVFAVAFFMVLFSDAETSTLPGTVAQNIYIILLPGLALCGWLRVMTTLSRRGPGGFGCMFYLLLLLPCVFLFMPFVLALLEVGGRATDFVFSKLKPKDDDPFGGPPSAP